MEASCATGIKQKLSLWSIDSGFFFPLRDGDDAADFDKKTGSGAVNEEL